VKRLLAMAGARAVLAPGRGGAAVRGAARAYLGARRRARRRRVPRVSLRVPSPKVLAIAGAVLLLLLLGWLWFRDSSLVAVKQVQIVGLRADDPPTLRVQLHDAAMDMTTMHVRVGRLRAAVAPYPAIRDVRVRREFPHKLIIEVVERVPVASLVVSGRHIAVAADGTLLSNSPTFGLPRIPVSGAVTGNRLKDPGALKKVALLAAAPGPLRERVRRVSATRRGLTVVLRNGLLIVFGSSERLADKWRATAAVLADRRSQGATYIDVRYPERPAAGGVGDPQEGMQGDSLLQPLAGQAPAAGTATGQTATTTGQSTTGSGQSTTAGQGTATTPGAGTPTTTTQAGTTPPAGTTTQGTGGAQPTPTSGTTAPSQTNSTNPQP
jgi:cell division protein FtsQ